MSQRMRWGGWHLEVFSRSMVLILGSWLLTRDAVAFPP